jgi:hypothetical protein
VQHPPNAGKFQTLGKQRVTPYSGLIHFLTAAGRRYDKPLNLLLN